MPFFRKAGMEQEVRAREKAQGGMNMSLLVLQDIVKEYRNQRVLDRVTLTVQRGERVALIGPNGAGKSTLLRIAMGLETPDGGYVIRARQTKVGYLSQDLKEISECSRALEVEKVIRMEQRLRALERQMEESSRRDDAEKTEKLLKDYAELVDRYEAMDGYSIEAKVKAILLGLGLREEALTLPLERLSGGEKMRVAMSRLLLEEPDLLILDEPTNHLDIQAMEWLESFLCKFEGGVLIVSHDRYFLDRVSTRVAELDGGTLFERSGNYSSFMEQKRIRGDFLEREKRRLRWQINHTNRQMVTLRSVKNIKGAQSRAKVLERMKAELAEGVAKAMDREHLHKGDNLRLSFASAGHISAEIARAENLTKRFGDVVLFSGAEFLIRGGEHVAIVGPNGCGKTTLFRILMGKDLDFEGFARLGSWVKYGHIGQVISFEDENRTVLQEIMAKKEMTEAEAKRLLSRFRFYGDQVEKCIKVLSGGERMRLTLAEIMLEEPHCLLLDEPTNHLDVPTREALEEALRSFRGTVIAISHDRYFLTHCIDRILEISGGKIKSYKGNYEAYRQAKLEPENRGRPVQEKGLAKAARGMKSAPSEESVRQREAEALEKEIESLEAAIREMENSFNEETPYERYREYETLLRKRDEQYARWEKLIR